MRWGKRGIPPPPLLVADEITEDVSDVLRASLLYNRGAALMERVSRGIGVDTDNVVIFSMGGSGRGGSGREGGCEVRQLAGTVRECMMAA